MILEHAVIHVTPGEEDDFEAALKAALPVIESAEGCRGAEVRRQLEDGSVYLLLVRWTSLEVHRAFRESALFEQWRDLTPHFRSQPFSVTHFHEPVER